jgi:hypothetical protein
MGEDEYDGCGCESGNGGSSNSGWLDRLQGFLDVAGFVPGPAGMFADLGNAGVSLLRGDLAGAGINAIATIPAIGDGYKGGKMLAKGADAVSAGKAFTSAQKKQLREANMIKNGGVLRSDLSGEPLVLPQQSMKGVTPPHNEAHVDHIFPRSLGGTNSPDNAQILSRLENLLKGNRVPPPN